MIETSAAFDEKLSRNKPRLVFDASHYHCQDELSKEENLALDALQERWRSGGDGPWSINLRRQLDRLLSPLRDALQAISAPPVSASIVTLILLREVAARRTAFWSWQQPEWIEIIGADSQAFMRRHAKPGGYRQLVKAIGYLFEGLTDLRACGGFFQHSFACKVFDRAIVDHSVQRVLDEILRWGYGPAGAKDSIPSLLCEVLLSNRSPHLEDLTLLVLRNFYHGETAARLKKYLTLLSRVLVEFGILNQPSRL